MKNCVLERIHTRWKGYLKIYTDGSKLEDKSTGSGFYIPELGITRSYKLSSINIMRAQLVAIVMALEWLEDSKGMSVVFLTDSLSAIQALESSQKVQNTLVADIMYTIKVLQMSDIEINFEWIPSHFGVRGNEIADTLVKKGALKENIELEIVYIKEELTNHMSSVYKEIWQFQWESSLMEDNYAGEFSQMSQKQKIFKVLIERRK